MNTLYITDNGTDFVNKLNANFTEAGSGSGGGNSLSAKSFGAVGDGVTDDTDALDELFKQGYLQQKAIFFEPGTYLIRRSLCLRSGMEVYGDSATIKKKAAYTTTLASAAVKGASYIDVTNASGFSVGDQFYIADGRNGGTDWGANWCTYGVITSIEGNRINFKSCLSPSSEGCVMAHVAGRQVSSSFALLRSWATLYDCDGVFIHDLTLDGNKTSSEPHEWSNGCIHIDADNGQGYTSSIGLTFNTIQRNLIARDLVIKNSSFDGISDQGRSGAVIENCRIMDCYKHGIHFGTNYTNGKVINCTITNMGFDGVFWCQGVNDIIVSNNYISSCNKGVSEVEYATPANNSIISNNIFDGIKNVVFDFSKDANGYGNLLIANNIIKNVKSTVAKFTNKTNVTFSGNIITNFSTAPSYVITLSKVNNAVITNNVCPTNTNYISQSTVTGLIEGNNSWNYVAPETTETSE